MLAQGLWSDRDYLTGIVQTTSAAPYLSSPS
jgi:hypothetical protein